MSAPDGERFDARSPVGRYWLMHGLGFTVQTAEGRTLGTVDEVLCDSVRQRAQRVTLRRPGLGRLLGSTTLLPSLVETVVPESKLFIVRAPAGEVRMPRRRRVRGADPAARVGALLARLGAALARVAANARPLARWTLRHGAAAFRFAGEGVRRGARSGANASATAAAWTRREAPRLDAWLGVHTRTSGRATAKGLRALGSGTRVASARLAAGTRVASARLAAATRVASSRLAAGARAAARALAEVVVLVAVFVSDTWKQAIARAPAQTTPPPELPRTTEEDRKSVV